MGSPLEGRDNLPISPGPPNLISALQAPSSSGRLDKESDPQLNRLGIARPLAAFHLDKLVEQGLLEASYRRLTKRRGPGAGRPAKLYCRSGLQVNLSLPPREYELAARLFASAAAAFLRRVLASERALATSALSWGGKPGVVPGNEPVVARCCISSRRCYRRLATSRFAPRTGRSGYTTAPSTRWRATIVRSCAE